MLMQMEAENSAGKELKQYTRLKFKHFCTILANSLGGTKIFSVQGVLKNFQGEKSLKEKQQGILGVKVH